MDISKRTQRGLALLEDMLGPERLRTTRATWQRICPDFDRYVTEMLFGEIWQRPGPDLRTRSLVTIAALAALGRPLALELNIRGALGNGATKEDVLETLLQIAPYAGFPACWEGLAVAGKVFQECDQA